MQRFLLASFLMAVGCGPASQGDTAGATTDGPGIATLVGVTDATSTTSATDATPTGPDGGTTGAASESSTFDPNDCGEAKVELPIVTPSVMLILDKSGSMVSENSGHWDHDGDDADDDGTQDADMMSPATPKISRWHSLHAVVEFIVGSFDKTLDLGMVLFPSTAAESVYNEAACPVAETPEVPVGSMNGQAILAAIPAASDTKLKGGTPAATGVEVALEELLGLRDDRPDVMILVTDGAANCSADAVDDKGLFEVYDENLPAIVGEAFTTHGIPTYVVGIAISSVTTDASVDSNPDNTNVHDRLNEVAVAGGVPRPGDDRFYDTQNQIELQAALAQISAQILSCTIALNPVPKYPEHVEVSVGGVDYGKTQVTDCAAEDGWMFTTAAMDEIVLCGEACADFQTTGLLDAQYRCPTSG